MQSLLCAGQSIVPWKVSTSPGWFDKYREKQDISFLWAQQTQELLQMEHSGKAAEQEVPFSAACRFFLC